MGADIITVAESWPAQGRGRARALVAEYGLPEAETADYLEWGKAEPWQRVRVRRDGLIEETVSYAIPEERLAQVHVFAGRLFVDILHHEVTVMGESEEVNRLMLNLMHDVLVGEKTLGQAWEKYEWSQQALRWHWPDPYLTKLQFHTDEYQMHAGEGRRKARKPQIKITANEAELPAYQGSVRGSFSA